MCNAYVQSFEVTMSYIEEGIVVKGQSADRADLLCEQFDGRHDFRSGGGGSERQWRQAFRGIVRSEEAGHSEMFDNAVFVFTSSQIVDIVRISSSEQESRSTGVSIRGLINIH